MSHLVTRRSVSYVTAYCLTCELVNAAGQVIERGMGYSFPCDAKGTPLALRPEGQASLDGLRSGAIRATPLTIEARQERVEVCAVVQCDCGRKVTLCSGWANECDCGAEYNGSGQLLAPRAQWGEETGEQGTF